MEYRVLGESGLKVSRLCFGALTIGPLQCNLPLSEGAEVIRKALDLGVNFIDTAELYGTYPYIREALKGRSEEVIIATKSYAYEGKAMAKSLEGARQDLDRDIIDIFLLHEQESSLTLRGHWEAFEYLLEAKAKGLIRAVGLSTHHVKGVLAAINNPEIEVIHPLLNLRGVGINDGSVADMLEMVDNAYACGKGIYSMKPLGGGNLIQDRKEAFDFVLGLEKVSSVAVGMKSTAEVELNVKIFNGQQLAAIDIEKVDKINRKLHIEGWCQGCGRCVNRCTHKALGISGGRVVVDPLKCALCGYCGAVCPDFCIKII